MAGRTGYLVPVAALSALAAMRDERLDGYPLPPDLPTKADRKHTREWRAKVKRTKKAPRRKGRR